jgi:dTDP-glucose 4,6-dehydratase
MQGSQVDIVLHFAAQLPVDGAFCSSFEFIQTNVLRTCTLLECAEDYHIKRFIHVITDEICGEVTFGEAKETVIVSPSNPSVCSKAAAEFVCQSYIHSSSLPTRITRGRNVFARQRRIRSFAIIKKKRFCGDT